MSAHLVVYEMAQRGLISTYKLTCRGVWREELALWGLIYQLPLSGHAQHLIEVVQPRFAHASKLRQLNNGSLCQQLS